MKIKIGKTLSASRVSNYEQGLRMPKPEEAKLLGEFYGVPAAYIMCLDAEDEMNKEEFEMLRDYRRLPENERRDYARRIQALALVYRDAMPDERLPAGIKAKPVRGVRRTKV